MEYLVRTRERIIEILRGELEEARQLRAQTDEDMSKVQAQNQ